MGDSFLKEEEIREIMWWIVDTILKPHFISLGLNATGQWLDSVGVVAEGSQGIITGTKYTEQLVWGRKPGRLPPISELQRWAEVKLGLSGRDALSAAFAISKKIAKEGTEIYKEGGTNLLEILNTPESQRMIKEKIGVYVTANVKIAIERELKRI